jgi:hypothetical protein
MSLGPGQLDLRDSFVEYYRGVNVYGHADTPGLYFFWGATLYDNLLNEIAAENKIDELSKAGVDTANPVDVAPPVSGLELLETYRGVPIYRGRYSYMGDPHDPTALPTVHAKIDELLAAEVYVPPTQPPYTPPTDGGLTPPPDGGDSLLGQIVAAIQAWLSPLLTPLQNAWNDFWWYTWPEWTVAFTKLGDAWDEFKTSTWVSLTTSFSGLKGAWDTFWTRDYPAMLAARQAKEAALETLVEQRRKELEVTVSVGDAATLEKMKTNFPGWFLEAWATSALAPFTFMFKLLANPMVQGIAESFWRGLDEGLRE